MVTPMSHKPIEVSEHLLRVFQVVRDGEGWESAKSAAKKAKISDRTARAHCSMLVKQGIFEEVRLHPSHRYALSPKAEKNNAKLLAQLVVAEVAI